jgi:hypothetical protein
MRMHLLCLVCVVSSALLGSVPVAAGDRRDLTLVAELRGRGANVARVLGIGADGKAFWQFDTAGIVIDAHMIGDDRVLYACGKFIIEANVRGEVLWRKEVKVDAGSFVRPVARLPNGKTLVAESYRLLEVDREGNQAVIYRRKRVNGYGIMDAHRLQNGHIGIITSDAMFRLLDASGNELKSFSVGTQTDFQGTGKLDVLPSGGVLVTQWNSHRAVEYSADGKRVWEAAVRTPTSAQRLANGNTLVSSQEDCSVVELDPKGKEVWRYRGQGSVLLARRR